MPEGELTTVPSANDPSVEANKLIRMEEALRNTSVPLHVPAPHMDLAQPKYLQFGANNYGKAADGRSFGVDADISFGVKEGGLNRAGRQYLQNLPVKEGLLDSEVSGFTKVSSLAEQYEPTDDEDTAELVKYYEEEVPVQKAVESIINKIVEEAGVPDDVSEKSKADAQENANSVRSPAPDVAAAGTAQFSDVVDSLVHDASRWEAKYTKMVKKIKPDDGILVSYWVQMKFAGAESIMCNYMKVEVLRNEAGASKAAQVPRLKLSLARRRGNDFPCRFRSLCGRYLHDEITYLEYGEYELDLARVNPDGLDNIDSYIRLEDVAQLIVTHRKRGPIIRDVSAMDEDLPYFGDLVLSVHLDNACNNIELNLDGSYGRRVKNHHVRYSTEGNKRRTLATPRALAGNWQPGPSSTGGIPTRGGGFFFQTGPQNLEEYLNARAAVMVDDGSDSESSAEYDSE